MTANRIPVLVNGGTLHVTAPWSGTVRLACSDTGGLPPAVDLPFAAAAALVAALIDAAVEEDPARRASKTVHIAVNRGTQVVAVSRPFGDTYVTVTIAGSLSISHTMRLTPMRAAAIAGLVLATHQDVLAASTAADRRPAVQGVRALAAVEYGRGRLVNAQHLTVIATLLDAAPTAPVREGEEDMSLLLALNASPSVSRSSRVPTLERTTL